MKTLKEVAEIIAGGLVCLIMLAVMVVCFIWAFDAMDLLHFVPSVLILTVIAGIIAAAIAYFHERKTVV